MTTTAPLMKAGMGMKKKKPARDCKDLTSEDHDYVRDHCLVPSESLKTFTDVHGARYARRFAEEYQPESDGGIRALSGLLLFGPSGTGKSLLAQAITNYIGGTMYTLSGADLPNGKAGAQIIDALFDVALAGEKPAVICNIGRVVNGETLGTRLARHRRTRSAVTAADSGNYNLLTAILWFIENPYTGSMKQYILYITLPKNENCNVYHRLLKCNYTVLSAM